MIIGLHNRTANYSTVAKAAVLCRKRGLKVPGDFWLECLKSGTVPSWAPQYLWKEGEL